MHCTCKGPEVPSLLDGPYKDVNPSCDLCKGYSLSYVPTFRSQQTINTGGYGNQNCLGLYEAALNGNVLSSEACQDIHDVYEDCCSLPDLPGDSGGGSVSQKPSSNSGTTSPSQIASSPRSYIPAIWTTTLAVAVVVSLGM